MSPITDTLTEKIIDYIKDHPGCQRADILASLPTDTTPGTVSSTMGRLSRTKAIENRGGFTKSAAWYATIETMAPEYLDIAEDLLEELKDVHHTNRPEYLSNRLKELFG